MLKIKKYFFHLLGMFFSLQLFSQSTYLISYHVNLSKFDMPTFNRVANLADKDFDIQMLFNDTISYYSFIDENESIQKNFESILNKRKLYHLNFVYLSKKKLFQVLYLPEKGKRILQQENLISCNWIVDSTDKKFLNYRCREAYTLLGNLDTLFVLFSTELTQPFGPIYLQGAPGVILEAYNQKDHYYFIANKIEKISYEMDLPRDKIFLKKLACK